MKRRPGPTRSGARLLLCLGLVVCGACQRSTGGEDSTRAGGADLRPVEVSSLDAFPEPVRQQLQAQQSRLEALAGRRPRDVELLGRAYGRMGQLLLAYELNRAAEPALLNAADLIPGDYRWPYYLGHAYQGLGETERAARYFERAMELGPRYVPARIHLAEADRELGRDADARKLLEEALRIDPQNAVAHVLLGHLAAADDPSSAVQHYEAALRLQPGASVVRYPLARAYEKLGDAERSREALKQRGQAPVRLSDPLMEELAEIRTGTGADVYRGNQLLARHQYREAATVFERALQEDSTNVSANLNLAIAVAQVGETDRAVRALKRVLSLDPSNSRAHYNLGVLALLSDRRGKEEEALEHFRAALAADPGSEAAHLAIADLLWRRRSCGKAVEHYEAYLAVRPGAVQARIKEAICQAQLRDYARARAVLETGRTEPAPAPQLADALVRILAASPDAAVRDGERALALARPLAAAHPRAETLESLAMAYAEVGRFEQATAAQEAAIRAAERQALADGMIDFLKANLRRYQRGEPCRTPWSRAVFES